MDWCWCCRMFGRLGGGGSSFCFIGEEKVEKVE